jgi:transcriptional regulator with PAS, ATPase and Fis domain
MIENIKNKIWDVLKDKEVSLAMIFNKEGAILWNKTNKFRQFGGNNVLSGYGFSKSAVNEVLKNNSMIHQENIFMIYNEELPQSAKNLKIKSLLILPCNNYYLYLDSGTKQNFSENDIAIFRTMGELLNETIVQIREHSPESDFYGLVGTSEAILFLREQIIKYSIYDDTILITGETGVGKSHVAEMIHKFSGRKGANVYVHTPNISENLFESELFGHKKGAFTDAKENKSGLVAEAEGGTLFLDEISEVPLSFQAKLLRLIDKKSYKILGETIDRTSDVRIIAATNRNLIDMIKKNIFREDLYYRLQVLEIDIPPLRKRKMDIKPLVLKFSSLLKNKKIGKGFFEALESYDWPGNTRELINFLIKVGIHCDDPITSDQVNKLFKDSTGSKAVLTDERNEQLQKIAGIYHELKAGKNFWQAVREPYLKHDLNREEVKQLIRDSLKETNGKYIDLLKPFNLEKDDYKKFINFLIANDLK